MAVDDTGPQDFRNPHHFSNVDSSLNINLGYKEKAPMEEEEVVKLKTSDSIKDVEKFRQNDFVYM